MRLRLALFSVFPATQPQVTVVSKEVWLKTFSRLFTENVLQAEGRCNYPLPVKISFKVQNFHFQLSLFVDSIFYILVAKMVRYSQDIIIELQSGLEAWPERFSRPDCPHGTLCAWLTHAHDVLCAWHTHAHVRVAMSRARILYTKLQPNPTNLN